MNTNKTITTKLDGNGHTEEARARGHECDWNCLKTPTPYCLQNDDLLFRRMKHECIDRARDALKRLDPHNKDQSYDYYEAFETLVAHNALDTKKKKPNRYELGAREFTLTYSPKWMNDAQAREEMEKAMNKLIKYYEGEIVKLRAVGEVGSNGLSHIHCFYKMEGGKKITDKNFKRAWKYWNPLKPLGRGFEGGHHANVKEESDFLGYIDKDILTSWYEKTISPMDITNASQEIDETSSSCSSSGP